MISLKALLIFIVVAFAFGFYMAPEKIKIQKEIQYVESTKKQSDESAKQDSQRDKRVEKTTTEITRPDGTKEVSTRTVEDSTTSRKSESARNERDESNKTSTEKETKEITAGRNHLTISALAGPQLKLSSGVSLGPLVYGAHITRPLLGPITVGLWGMSSGSGGMSLGLTF